MGNMTRKPKIYKVIRLFRIECVCRAVILAPAPTQTGTKVIAITLTALIYADLACLVANIGLKE